jgi:hypothetical protein
MATTDQTECGRCGAAFPPAYAERHQARHDRDATNHRDRVEADRRANAAYGPVRPADQNGR